MSELEYLLAKMKGLENAVTFLTREFGKVIAQEKLNNGEIKNQDQYIDTLNEFESKIREMLIE
jgi:hypothetical protein